ncbi:hypothetical protein SAMN03159341_10876 [Paenibacillus sp. 1_12]|uniref:hypothetical protein n=1 Tax=Paenibacillus sp. 1_12 TaxID=1566278 RepID=UPI0008EDC6B6|nr:hypothetical protein [Paenibacillus sp. 1_12]SFL65278.1 hypothetical protein SAMN03159341_10876 [Paenibacillus sp. 1_12]
MISKKTVSKKLKKTRGTTQVPATVQTSGTRSISAEPRGLGAGSFPQGTGGGFAPPYPGGVGGFPPSGGGGGFAPPFPGGGGGFPPSGGGGGFAPPFPGGGGGFPPGPPQGGGPGASGAPQSPPPSFIPQQQSGVSALAVDPGSIRRCVNRYVYIWQRNGDAYWMFLTHVGRNSISGFRWYGIGPAGFWLFFGIDLQRIEQFNCF